MPSISPCFVGLDLAWSAANRTGGAVIQDGTLRAWSGVLTDDASIEAFIATHVPEDAPLVIAIDAPLRVPNEHGRRRADHEVSVAWGRFQAGAYPANRTLLAYGGVIRGETLAARLVQRFGCVESAPIPQRGAGRYLCEVFPHPAQVALFDLPRTLKYKRKPGRTPASVAAEFARYQQALAALATADPPLTGQGSLVTIDAGALRGRALQELEETLDAVTCAYVAWYAWHHGPARQRVYGSVAEGHILVPWPEAMAARMAAPPLPKAKPSPPKEKPKMTSSHHGTPPPDTLNARIGVLTRREVEARILAPIIDALGDAFGRDEVIAVVRDAIIRLAQEQGAHLATTMGGDDLPAFAESLRFWTQDNALELEVLAQDGERFDFNVTRCRYAELYRNLGIPELGAVLSCNRDWALIQGFNQEIDLERTQTIMQGAAYCDFRYRHKERRESA